MFGIRNLHIEAWKFYIRNFLLRNLNLEICTSGIRPVAWRLQADSAQPDLNWGKICANRWELALDCDAGPCNNMFLFQIGTEQWLRKFCYSRQIRFHASPFLRVPYAATFTPLIKEAWPKKNHKVSLLTLWVHPALAHMRRVQCYITQVPLLPHNSYCFTYYSRIRPYWPEAEI
jgi:hypothetical protein